MKRIAMISGGAVQGVSVWDGVSLWHPEGYDHLIDTTDRPEIGPGWLYDGQTFTEPVPPEEG